MDLPLDSIICHDVTQPFPLPDQCIDVVVTSPPYYGLRDYGIKSIFGGDPNCKHKWSEEKTGLTHENRNFQKGSQEEVVGQKGTTWIRKYDEISSGFCQICGAWFGQLGLECVSDDTEILTIDGWRKRKDIKEGREVATLNITNETIEYQPILKIFNYKYNGKMVRIKNFHVDMLVTPNHRILHRYRSHSGNKRYVTDWLYTLAKDLKYRCGIIIPVSGRYEGRYSIGNDLAELIGWILTDGTFSTRGKRYRITIFQSKKDNIKRIYYLLDKLNIKYSVHKRKEPTNFCINPKERCYIRFSGKWARKIRKIIPDKKLNPFVLHLKEDELKRLFDGIYGGDGSGQSIYGKPEEFRDNLQILLFHLGLRSFWKDSKKAVEFANRKTTEVSGKNRRKPDDRDYGISNVSYNGIVWCVKTQNNNFVARRGKKVFITGNSHPQMYIDHLVMICREIKRVLKKSGSFYLNLGDTYFGGGQGGGNKNAWKGKSKKYGHIKLKADHNWLQPKQLLGIPERVMVALQNDGWILRNKNVWHKINSMPSSVKDRLNSTWEPVFHFVKVRKYYYDLDAIREPHKESSLDRAKYDFNLIPRAWEQEVIPVSGGKKVNIDCHPAGKNPGDIFYRSKYKEIPEEIASENKLLDKVAYERKILGIPHDLSTTHPMGPNPGDVVKHDIAVGRIGNFSYNDPLHTKEYHPSGKNPGDVIQFDEQYWWNFILGKAHSNKFYKKAYELMKNWMIKNNCFDYNIFYEWYKKEFEGKWESGTLEKGKANYLSDGKRLPFPKPETRFLGDMSSDFWKINPEYIIGTLAKKIRDFYDAHPDADLGWLDDIIRDIVLANPDDFIYPSDFWSLTTQPFTGYNPDLEHFAVFPEDLVLKPLKASCPKEICRKCGKPRIRITKLDNPSKTDFDRDNLVKATEVQKTSNPQSIKSLHRNPSPDGKTKGVYYSGKTVGWSDCGCNAGFDAGVVLDPFCGRGTVGKVAKQLGLHYILFDAKPEYCELARLYIGGQKHKLHKDQSKLNV